VATIWLGGNVALGVGVLRGARKEEAEECPYIFSSSWGVGGGRTSRKMALACSVSLYGLYLVKGAEVVDEVTFFVIE
jgi:hypothetical protein